MSATRTYHFDHYLLRPVNETDATFAINWTLEDPHHRDLTMPDFWLEQTGTRDSYILLDNEGRVFFLKLHKLGEDAVDIHIQFSPDDSRHQTMRVSKALMVGLEWLEEKLRAHGIRHLSFDSASDRLIYFAIKKLKFHSTEDYRLEKEIA